MLCVLAFPFPLYPNSGGDVVLNNLDLRVDGRQRPPSANTSSICTPCSDFVAHFLNRLIISVGEGAWAYENASNISQLCPEVR